MSAGRRMPIGPAPRAHARSRPLLRGGVHLAGASRMPAPAPSLPRREAPRPWGLCPRTNRGAGQAPAFRAYSLFLRSPLHLHL